MSDTSAVPNERCPIHGNVRVKRVAAMTVAGSAIGPLSWWECPQCVVEYPPAATALSSPPGYASRVESVIRNLELEGRTETADAIRDLRARLSDAETRLENVLRDQLNSKPGKA